MRFMVSPGSLSVPQNNLFSILAFNLELKKAYKNLTILFFGVNSKRDKYNQKFFYFL